MTKVSEMRSKLGGDITEEPPETAERESLDTRPRQREVEGWARQLVRVRVTILGAQHPRVLRVGEAHEVPEPRVAGDDYVSSPVRPSPGCVTPVLRPGQVLRGAAPRLQGHRGRAAARGQVQRGRAGGQRTLGPGDRAGGAGLRWDRVAARQRARDWGRGRLGDGDQQHRLDDGPGEVEITARLARDPGLLAKLDPHYVVSLTAEHGAHEARIAAALDVGDRLDPAQNLKTMILSILWMFYCNICLVLASGFWPALINSLTSISEQRWNKQDDVIKSNCQESGSVASFLPRCRGIKCSLTDRYHDNHLVSLYPWMATDILFVFNLLCYQVAGLCEGLDHPVG